MIKTIKIRIELIAEENVKFLGRIVDIVPASDKIYPVSVQYFTEQLEMFLSDFGDVEILGISDH